MKGKLCETARRDISLLLAGLLLFACTACKPKDISLSSEEITESSTVSDGMAESSGNETTEDSGQGTTAKTEGPANASSQTPPMVTTVPVLSGNFEIVKNGNAIATIVIAKNATDKVRTAAEDLQNYLQKMTGASVKIGFDSTDRTQGNYILVGPSKYTEKLGITQPTGYPNKEKVILKRIKNYLVLMGNDSGAYTGTQFAVTMFLEKQGCGWFGPEELWQVVPQTKNISVGALDIVHTPKFYIRQNNVYNNSRQIGMRWYLGGEEVALGHYLPHLVGRESTFDQHPEWFSQINGKRDPFTPTWWQYCYSNAELAKEVAKNVIARFDANPNLMTFPIAANDGWETDWCECDECAKYPTDTDVMLEFANRVARIVNKKYPDKRVSILSYHSTWFAPKTAIQAEPNVEVMFCRETSMTSPIEDGLFLGNTRNPITHNTYNTSWKDNFLLYKNKANLKNASIWEWYCLSVETPSWQTVPWVQGDVAIRNQNYWKNNGIKYIFYDQGPLANYRETEASFPLRWPLWYVAAKGMWDSNLSSDQILGEACGKLYGKGGDAMLAYYNTLADASKQCTASSMCWMPPDPGEIYTAEVVRKVDAAIAKAKAQLSNVTSLQRQRMENQIKLWETAKGTF